MNALLLLTILAVATPIFGEEAVEVKKQEKRGIVGLGYGGHGLGYGGHYGLNTLGYGYHGLGHGYLGSPYYSGASHVAPAVGHSYSAPLVLPHNSLSHGYSGLSGYYAPSSYSAPLRLGYAGLGHGYHGYSAGHGW